jgi:hypothetical protein
VRFDCRPTILLDDQHSAHRWMYEVELKAAIDVHDDTKAYFCWDPGHANSGYIYGDAGSGGGIYSHVLSGNPEAGR